MPYVKKKWIKTLPKSMICDMLKKNTKLKKEEIKKHKARLRDLETTRKNLIDVKKTKKKGTC